MATIAPWLERPDYVGIMARGAGLGLQARAQDVQEEEAGDRLRLAYTQLASQERQQAAQAKAMQDYRLAQMGLRSQQQAMLQDYRERDIARKIDAAKESMDLRQKLAEATIRHQKEVEDLNQRKFERALDPEEKGLMAEYAKAQAAVDMATRKAAQFKVMKPETVTQSNWSLRHPLSFGKTTTTSMVPAVAQVGELTPDIADAQLKAAQDLLEEKKSALEAYRGGGTALQPSPTPPPAPAPEPKPKGRVRVKSPSGKFGTIDSENLDEALAAGYTKAE